MLASEILPAYRALFWDFDGVIKDSLDVKTKAFLDLFLPFGEIVARKVCDHHLANGGMSRMEKIPLYLRWAGEDDGVAAVSEYCWRFGSIVRQSVIDSPWVPGVERILRSNPYRQQFIVVSATPYLELIEILQRLSLVECFARVYGSPTHKPDAIQATMTDYGLDPARCLMIGDALADLVAAESTGVAFLLRRHKTNQHVFSSHAGPYIEDFTQ